MQNKAKTSIELWFLRVAFFCFPLTYVKIYRNYDLSDLLLTLSFLIIINKALFSIDYYHKTKNRFAENIYKTPFLIYSIGILLSIQNSIYITESILSYIQLIFIFIVVQHVISMAVRDINEIRHLLIILLIGILFQSCIMLLYYLFGFDLTFGAFRLMGWRTRYTFGGLLPNLAARLIAMTIPIIVTLIVVNKNKVARIVLALSIFLMSFAVFITGSRSGFVIIIFMLTLHIFYLNKRSKASIGKKWFYTIIVTIAVSIIFSLLIPEGTADRLKTILNPGSSLSSRERIHLLEQAIDQVSKHPFIGVGFEQFQFYTLEGKNVHNSIIAAWVENGIIGMIGWVFFYLIILFSLIRGYRNNFNNSIWLLSLAIIISGIVIGDMFMTNAYRRFFWGPILLFVHSINYLPSIDSRETRTTSAA